MVAAAYANGFKDGDHLIGRLASGSISIDQLNEISMKSGKPKVG